MCDLAWLLLCYNVLLCRLTSQFTWIGNIAWVFIYLSEPGNYDTDPIFFLTIMFLWPIGPLLLMQKTCLQEWTVKFVKSNHWGSHFSSLKLVPFFFHNCFMFFILLKSVLGNLESFPCAFLLKLAFLATNFFIICFCIQCSQTSRFLNTYIHTHHAVHFQDKQYNAKREIISSGSVMDCFFSTETMCPTSLSSLRPSYNFPM